jgi:hypothetical protein
MCSKKPSHFHALSNLINVINIKRTRWAGCVIHINTDVWSKNLKVKDHFEDLSIDGSKLFKLILNNLLSSILRSSKWSLKT